MDEPEIQEIPPKDNGSGLEESETMETTENVDAMKTDVGSGLGETEEIEEALLKSGDEDNASLDPLDGFSVQPMDTAAFVSGFVFMIATIAMRNCPMGIYVKLTSLPMLVYSLCNGNSAVSRWIDNGYSTVKSAVKSWLRNVQPCSLVKSWFVAFAGAVVLQWSAMTKMWQDRRTVETIALNLPSSTEKVDSFTKGGLIGNADQISYVQTVDGVVHMNLGALRVIREDDQFLHAVFATGTFKIPKSITVA